ncbi:MAG: hypothetical protein IT562_08505 [Alphaproteobacteria bacterium]|nr:hypothetical protein [Alphaproteobacteria bacterium]
METLCASATPNLRDLAMPKMARGRKAKHTIVADTAFQAWTWRAMTIEHLWRQLGDWWDVMRAIEAAAKTTPESGLSLENQDTHATHAADALRDAILLQPAKRMLDARIQLRLAAEMIDKVYRNKLEEPEHDACLKMAAAGLSSAIAVIDAGQPPLPGTANEVFTGGRPEWLFHDTMRPGEEKLSA